MATNLDNFKKHVLDALTIEMNWGTEAWWRQKKHIEQHTQSTEETDLLFAEQERVYELELLGRNYHRLQGLKAALVRIQKGTFGDCQCCGEMISEDRLIANPTTINCFSCQEEQEKQIA